MKWIQGILLVLLLVLLRKLIWCLRWLWCYTRGKELPEERSLLPQQSGDLFEKHIRDKENRSKGEQ
jgi:hypothetical protein